MTLAQRTRQKLAELRVDEGVRWLEQTDLIAGFRFTDAAGDQRMFRLLRAHRETLTSDEQKATFTAVVREYLADEHSEERSIAAQDDHATTAFAEHRANTPTFVNGAATPHGSGGAA